MAHVQVAGHQHGLHRLGQVQQAQQVRGRAAGAAHGLGSPFVRQPKFFYQPLQALRFFEWVEVFALDVFDQGHGRSGLIGHIAHQHGYAVESG